MRAARRRTPFGRTAPGAAALLSFALTLLSSAGALAQGTEEDRATARKLAFEAQAALEQKDYVTAADKFSRAEALFHAPTLLLGLARANAGLGKLVAAQEGYQKIVRDGVPAGASKQFEEAVADAKKELAALEPRIPSVTLWVTGATDPAVTLDGALLPAGSLGLKRPIDPGQHALRATATGFRPGERAFTMKEGANETVSITLERDVAPPPAVAPAPLVPPQAVGQPLAAGTADAPSSGGPPYKALGIAALVLGGAGLVTGGITGGLAIREHSILERDCPDNDCPSDRKPTLDTFRTLATVSTIGFIVGGVGVAGGITLLVLAPSSRDKRAGVQPFVGLGNVGAVGRF